MKIDENFIGRLQYFDTSRLYYEGLIQGGGRKVRGIEYQ
jgi:hypothetical protein